MWTQKSGQMRPQWDLFGHNWTEMKIQKKKRNLEIVRILCKILVWNWENRKMWGQKASKWCGHWGPPLLALPSLALDAPTLELPPHCSTSPYLVHFLEERLENLPFQALISTAYMRNNRQRAATKQTNTGKVSNGIFDWMIRSKSRERRQRKQSVIPEAIPTVMSISSILSVLEGTHSRGQNGSSFHLFSWNTMEAQPSPMWWR